MNKKVMAGTMAVISTIVSIFLWFYYASLPSFSDSERTLSDFQTETFQTKEISK